MVNISTITVTLNEEKDIQRCLGALLWVDERILVDCYSMDNTVELAGGLATKIIQRQMDDFSSLRNFAISQAKGKWIFMIDADEVVTEELKEKVLEAINSNSQYDAYYVNRINYMYGIRLMHRQPDYILRLFKKTRGIYINPVHEKLVVSGKAGFLKGSILHFSMKDISEHIEKIDLYTDIHTKFETNFSLMAKITLFLRPFYRFVQNYLLRKAYKDGITGLILSLNSFYYEFIRLFKVWERFCIQRLEKNRWENFYSQVDFYKESETQIKIHHEFLDKIMEENPVLILEVGIGTFSTSLFFLKNNIKVVGIDNNLEIIKVAKDRLKDRGVFFICADGRNLPFKNNSVDVAYSQGLLEHFKENEIKCFVNEQLRVCKKSVFLSIPNNFYRHKDFGNENLWSKKKWEKILKDFNLVESKNYFSIRQKKNLLLKLPVMYYAKIKKEKQ